MLLWWDEMLFIAFICPAKNTISELKSENLAYGNFVEKGLFYEYIKQQ